MASLRFSSFMLVIVLFTFLTMNNTIAYSDNQAKQTFVVREAENGYAMASLRNNHEKEVLDGVPAAAEFTNGRVGGRKMTIERKNIKKNMKQVEATEEADSKNSGNSNCSANPLGESRKNTQNQSEESKNSTKSASGRNSKNSSKLALTDQPDDTESLQTLESEKLMEDTTEFSNMMNKDYTGGPGSGSKPRHKPPINNFQPFHRSNP
ncbi:uncharacterized protein LOC132058156 [Lycium ferocissimum]|uniref:uncharacterized protein LOC132058156 n=1 Tax=Lycium ferocissimum TaxID=112874 RepID=UPI00281554CE|nr:uncharacterized protein LOC132058156 [Lycium ferocissimum]